MTRRLSMRHTRVVALALVCTGAWACGAPALSPPEAEEENVAVATALQVPGKAKVVNATSLNLRAGPGTSYAVITAIPGGAEVDVLAGPQSNFYNVKYSGKTGWASGAYLQEVSAGGGGTGGVWRPRPGTSWQWQLTGTIDASINAQMYDVDLFTTPQSVIDALHGRGRVVICYFSAGSYEPGRPDSAQFPAAVKGKVMDGWPDERWLDIRAASVRALMTARLDRARAKKCDGVEPDNVDGFDNSTGFPLTAAQQLDYNRFLAREAHARGLSIGLKNDLAQVPSLVGDFDWALNEECFQYSECGTLAPFLNAGKAVFQVEYGGAALAARVCTDANRRNFDTLIKDLDLSAFRISCR